MRMPVAPVVPVAPRVVQFAPRPVAPASTVGNSVPVAVRPQAVPAMSRPGWPAPTSVAVVPTTVSAPQGIPVRSSQAGRVISESIFGGPVTAGDPAVVTVHESPYTDKVEPAIPNGLPADEGWSDIFGVAHGALVPESAQISRRSRGGAFGVRVSLGATDSEPCATLPAPAKQVWGRAGKGCDKVSALAWSKAWVAWVQATAPAGTKPGAASYTMTDYAQAILSGKAAPPSGWQLQGGGGGHSASREASVGTSGTTKVAVVVAALAAVGAGFYFMKRRKAQ